MTDIKVDAPVEETSTQENDPLKWFKVDLGVAFFEGYPRIYDIGIKIPDELTKEERDIFYSQYEKFVDSVKEKLIQLNPQKWEN